MIHVDAKHQLYSDVGNIRVTYVSSESRAPDKRWADHDVIRIQAYRGEEDDSLHLGAEIPIESAERLIELIAALCDVYTQSQARVHT